VNTASSSSKRRDGIVLITVWLLLSVGALAVAKQNLSVPGLYYDEAVFAGLAKDLSLAKSGFICRGLKDRFSSADRARRSFSRTWVL
jgi:hypothetical protein